MKNNGQRTQIAVRCPPGPKKWRHVDAEISRRRFDEELDQDARLRARVQDHERRQSRLKMRAVAVVMVRTQLQSLAGEIHDDASGQGIRSGLTIVRWNCSPVVNVNI
jgi:hypothetical protein